jgi:uncharacterized protein
MPSEHETFWLMSRYAVVGHSKLRPFPRLTYGALKKSKQTVYAVDPSTDRIEGDPCYPSISALPGPVDAVVIEVPAIETLQWVKLAVDHGVKDIWLHRNTDSPEAVAFAKEHGIRLRTGTCAVMYLHRGFSPHAVHGFIRRLMGKY